MNQKTSAHDFNFRRNLLRHPAAQYAFALLVLAGGIGVCRLLTPVVGREPLPFLIFLATVVVVSLTCGLYPSVFMVLATAVAENYLFLSPYHAFILTPQALVYAVLYLATGCAIVYMAQSRRRPAKNQDDWLDTRSILDRQTFQGTLRRAYWIPFSVAAIIGIALILEVRFLAERATWVEHTDEIIAVAQRIYQNQVDEETGLRAYVLTGDERFLEPFYADRTQALELEPQLRQLVSDNPEQAAKNENSVRAFAAWSSWADRAIAMTKAGEDAGGTKFQLQGKKLMDNYRQIRTEFIEREQELRKERMARSQNAVEVVNATIFALSALFSLGFVIVGQKQLTALSQSFTRVVKTAEGNAREARSQRDWLHTTLTSIGDAVIAADADGLVTLMNPMAERLTGWALQEAQGKPLADVLRIVNQETRQAVENPMDKVRRLNRVEGLANHTILISRSGQEIPIDDSGAPIFDPGGSMTGVVLVFHDVTQERRAEEAIRADQLAMKCLNEVASQCVRSGENQFDECLDGIVAAAISITGAEKGNVQLLDAKSGVLKIIAQRGFGEPFLAFFANVASNDASACSAAMQTGQRIIVEDVMQSEIFAGQPSLKALLDANVRAVQSTPLTSTNGGIQGMISTHFVQPHRPTERELQLMDLLARQAADYLERRQAEQALREATQRFSGLINSAMDAVIAVDAQQQIVLFNPAAERIFGCPASKALGSSLDRFIPPRFRDVHRHHIENFGQTGVTGRSMSRPGTLSGLRSTGEEFPIEATISQVDGNQKLFTVILRDITERKESETRLTEQARLLELSSDAIIVRDEDGCIAYWNKGAEFLYGWTQEEVAGKIIHDLLRTKFPEPLSEIVARVNKERRWQGELEHTRKGGDQVTVWSRWVLVPGEAYDSGTRSLMEINTDVTRRKQLESALQSNERLALAGKLSAAIAHEIHNPLDTVANALFLLARQIHRRPQTKKLISRAQGEVQRVAEISRNILSLHRESRAPFSVNLSELLLGVIALVEETIAKGRRKIEFHPSFKGEIEAFPAQLRQVFTNLIKNAVEATADGGEITIYTQAAEESGREGVLVRVVDNGFGIAEQVQSRLFNPFVSTKEESGTGLGLWVSRSIVEKHGGSIQLENSGSGKDRRTVVSLFLPLKMGSQNISDAERKAFA